MVMMIILALRWNNRCLQLVDFLVIELKMVKLWFILLIRIGVDREDWITLLIGLDLLSKLIWRMKNERFLINNLIFMNLFTASNNLFESIKLNLWIFNFWSGMFFWGSSNLRVVDIVYLLGIVVYFLDMSRLKDYVLSMGLQRRQISEFKMMNNERLVDYFLLFLLLMYLNKFSIGLLNIIQKVVIRGVVMNLVRMILNLIIVMLII